VERTVADSEEIAKARRKVQNLIDLAINAASPEEEQRTTAVSAVHLIAKHKLLDLPPEKPRDDGFPNPFGPNPFGIPRNLQAAFWQAEAQKYQAKLVLFATSMHLVLRARKIGLAIESDLCIFCQRLYSVGDTIVWKRRRSEASHYLCCVMEIERRAREEPVPGGVGFADVGDEQAAPRRRARR
jgi:hypothetical protein